MYILKVQRTHIGGHVVCFSFVWTPSLDGQTSSSDSGESWMLVRVRRVSGLRNSSFALLAIVVSARPSLAQSVTTGAIRGTLTMRKAALRSRMPRSKRSRAAAQGLTTVTNARGFYTLQLLQPDTYTVYFKRRDTRLPR